MVTLLAAVVAPAADELAWAKVFAFGDSYSDSGHGYVDGDGPTAIVYAARVLGIPFTHASDPSADDQGRNYAVSGARTGEGAGRKIKDARLGYGMQNQVREFVASVESGEITFDPERTLFFIAGGLNDGGLETTTTTENLSRIVRQLYEAGARQFSIAVLPTRIPAFARTGQRLNPALAALPAVLESQLPGATVRSSAWGRFFDEVMEQPERYGITNTTEACAGRALFDQDSTPRGDPATYYYYHEGHPSTAVHRHVGQALAQEFRDAEPRRSGSAGVGSETKRRE